MIKNWFRQQLSNLYVFFVNCKETVTNYSINNIRDIIVSTHKNEDTYSVTVLWIIKSHLNNIVKLQGLSKYKAFQYVFDRLNLGLSTAEVEQYRIALKDWFSN